MSTLLNLRNRQRLGLLAWLSFVIFSGALRANSLDSTTCDYLASRIFHPHPIEQMFAWELIYNIREFREEYRPIQSSAVIVPRAEVEVLNYGASPEVYDLFVKDNSVLWPRHPFNKALSVPYADSKLHTQELEVYLTASRSLYPNFAKGKKSRVTVKVGTDHIRPMIKQILKAETDRDVLGAELRMPYLIKMRQMLGENSNYHILHESLVLKHKATGEGVVVRDMHALKDDHHYVTALSLPYLFEDIAKKNDLTPDQFFLEHYVKKMGIAKAEILLDLGLEFVSPNSQNMILEFDANWKPTNRIIFRDISDTNLNKSLANGIGQSDAVNESSLRGSAPTEYLSPLFELSTWKMEDSGNPLFSHSSIISMRKKMYKKEEEAYLQHLSSALGKYFGSTTEVRLFISTSEGQLALAREHERRRKMPK